MAVKSAAQGTLNSWPNLRRFLRRFFVSPALTFAHAVIARS